MYVYANCDATTYIDGRRIALHVDDVWDAKDPVVLARPDLFNSDPKKVHRTTTPAAIVESATAAPGEKRAVRRGDK